LGVKGPSCRWWYWWERVVPCRYPLIIVFHLALFAAAYLSAYVLRFEGYIPEAYYQVMWRSLPVVMLTQAGLFYYYDLYSGLWRYVSFGDIQNILEATLLSLILVLNLNLFLGPYLGYIPRSIYIMDFLLLVALAGGSRFLVRYTRERWALFGPRENAEARRVLVVGPVNVAEPLIREMTCHARNYLPIALLDPDQHLHGYRVHNVLITGGLRRMIPLIQRYRIQEIIFAWPDASEDRLNRIIEDCRPLGVRFKILPSLREVLDGRVRLSDVRDIELEDLLPRPAIYIDREPLSEFIHNRVIMVTGAGGSIGSEICRQLARFQPRQLLLLERAENSLYNMEGSLKREFPDLDLQAQVGSINDGPGLRLLLAHYHPELIFHAAAYKHVPLMERHPLEAAYNNVLGTRNLAQAALAEGTELFVMISTDKAVNPTNVMGVTKRIAEKYVQSLNNGHTTRFVITRFGNVLGSAGSVIPLFRQQLALGGPLTVTHPDIERFFMTIPEAVQLVLQAAYMGRGGDIFVLNMGRSVKIRDLAEKLCLLAGKHPGKDIQILYTGLRPGEKLFEELFNREEQPHPTEHPLILRAVGPRQEAVVWEAHLDEIAELVRQRQVSALLAKFKSIIPNYHQDPQTMELNKPS